MNIRLMVLVFCLGMFLMPQNSFPAGGTVPEMIGDVAATLLKSSPREKAGPAGASLGARAWNDAVLKEGKQTPSDAVVTFQTWQKSKYDAVQYAFTIGKEPILTKQTFFVMVVSFPKQKTDGMTDEQLAALLESKARDYLAGFEHRHFVSSGQVNGAQIYRVTIDEGHATGDWRDRITGVVDRDVISFAFPKKQAGGAAVVSTAPELNKVWFEKIGKSKKGK